MDIKNKMSVAEKKKKRLPCFASKRLNAASERLSNFSPAPFVYDHTTRKVPVHVRSPKSSPVPGWVTTWESGVL